MQNNEFLESIQDSQLILNNSMKKIILYKSTANQLKQIQLDLNKTKNEIIETQTTYTNEDMKSKLEVVFIDKTNNIIKKPKVKFTIENSLNEPMMCYFSKITKNEKSNSQDIVKESLILNSFEEKQMVKDLRKSILTITDMIYQNINIFENYENYKINESFEDLVENIQTYSVKDRPPKIESIKEHKLKIEKQLEKEKETQPIEKTKKSKKTKKIKTPKRSKDKVEKFDDYDDDFDETLYDTDDFYDTDDEFDKEEAKLIHNQSAFGFILPKFSIKFIIMELISVGALFGVFYKYNWDTQTNIKLSCVALVLTFIACSFVNSSIEIFKNRDKKKKSILKFICMLFTILMFTTVVIGSVYFLLYNPELLKTTIKMILEKIL